MCLIVSVCLGGICLLQDRDPDLLRDARYKSLSNGPQQRYNIAMSTYLLIPAMRGPLTRLARPIAANKCISLASLEPQLGVGEDLDPVALGLPFPILVRALVS